MHTYSLLDGLWKQSEALNTLHNVVEALIFILNAEVGESSQAQLGLESVRSFNLLFIDKQTSPSLFLSLLVLAWSMMEKEMHAESLRATSCLLHWQDATGSSRGHPAAASIYTDF